MKRPRQNDEHVWALLTCVAVAGRTTRRRKHRRTICYQHTKQDAALAFTCKHTLGDCCINHSTQKNDAMRHKPDRSCQNAPHQSISELDNCMMRVRAKHMVIEWLLPPMSDQGVARALLRVTDARCCVLRVSPKRPICAWLARVDRCGVNNELSKTIKLKI